MFHWFYLKYHFSRLYCQRYWNIYFDKSYHVTHQKDRYPASIGTFHRYVPRLTKNIYIQKQRLWPVDITDGPRVKDRRMSFMIGSIMMALLRPFVRPSIDLSVRLSVNLFILQRPLINFFEIVHKVGVCKVKKWDGRNFEKS